MYSKAKRIIRCLFVIWIFVITQAIGQIFPPKFRPLSQEQGLSNNAVRLIYQDKSGFIWIATRSGLNRYDGYELQVYSKEGKGRYYTPWDDIHHICEDLSGRLLIILFNGEVVALNPATQAFEPYFTDNEKKRSGLKDLAVGDFYSDEAGILWLSTLNNGLLAFNQKKRTWQLYHTKSQPAILSNKVKSIFKDSQNRLWVATDIGLTVISVDRKSTTDYPIGTLSGDKQFNSINVIYEDRLYRMWIGTELGLFFFVLQLGNLFPLNLLPSKKVHQR